MLNIFKAMQENAFCSSFQTVMKAVLVVFIEVIFGVVVVNWKNFLKAEMTQTIDTPKMKTTTEGSLLI